LENSVGSIDTVVKCKTCQFMPANSFSRARTSKFKSYVAVSIKLGTHIVAASVLQCAASPASPAYSSIE